MVPARQGTMLGGPRRSSVKAPRGTAGFHDSDTVQKFAVGLPGIVLFCFLMPDSPHCTPFAALRIVRAPTSPLSGASVLLLPASADEQCPDGATVLCSLRKACMTARPRETRSM